MGPIGRVGESEFRNWCDRNNIAATKAEPDEHGWDFIIEFQSEADPSKPLDQQHSSVKALVQVKATCAASPSVKASVESLKKLVSANLPAFIAHFEYDQDQCLRRVRLLHIWEGEIAKILRVTRLCELKERALNSKELTLSLKSAVGVRCEYLKERFDSFLPENGLAYLAQKTEIRETCGYDDRPVSGHIEMDTKNFGQFVNVTIGLAESVQIKGGRFTHIRFGMSLSKDVQEFGESTLQSNAQPAYRGVLTAISEREGLFVDTEVDVYVPPIPNLSPEHQKIYAKNFFMSFLIERQPENSNVWQFSSHWSCPEDLQRTLKELSNALAFRAVCEHEDAEIEFKFESIKLRTPIRVSTASTHPNFRLLETFLNRLLVAEVKSQLAQYSHYSILNIESILEENLKLVSLVCCEGNEISFEFFSYEKIKFEEMTGKFSAFIPINIDIGDNCYYVIIRLDGVEIARERIGEIIKFRVTCGVPQILNEFIAEKSDARFGSLRRQAEALANKETRHDRMILAPRAPPFLDSPAPRA